MTNKIGHNQTKSPRAAGGQTSKLAPFSFLKIALRRLRFTNFRPLFTSKVLAKPPLWRRSRKLSHYINNISNFRKLAYASAVALLFLTISVVSPIYLVPENSEAATAYDPSTTSINITTGRGTSGVELDVTSNAGSFATNYNTASTAEFSVTTDNATGYDLSITADNGVNLTRSGGSETLSPITTSGITSDDFNTATYNNMWGYLPSYYNGEANTTKYYPITTNNATIEKTDKNKLSGTYTIALGVRADYSKPAGTYTSTIKLTAVGNPASYNITYDKNTTDTVTNLPSVLTGSTSATYAQLSGNTVIRTGYAFRGWCTAATSDLAVSVNVNTACTNASGTYYAAGANFFFDATTMNVTTLYAVWEVDAIPITATIYYQSDSTLGSATVTSTTVSCDLSNGATSCATDVPDAVRNSVGTYNNSYAGLATAVNSMTEAVAQNAATMSIAADSTYYAFYRTNVTNYYYNGGYTTRTLYRNQALSSTSVMGATYLSDATTGLSNYSTATGPSSATWSGLNTSVPTTSSTPTYTSVANAASASVSYTTLYTMYQFNVTYNTSSGNYASYITNGTATGNGVARCYVYPTGTSTGTTSCSVKTPTLTSSTSGVAVVGWCTSATATSGCNSANTSYTLSSSVTWYKVGKLNCTISSTISGNMQDAKAAACYSDGASGTMTDSRDNQTYTIAKINGNLWMTRNLAIGCNGSGSSYGSSVSSKSLTSSDSNVSSTWSTPTALLSTKANNSATSGYTTAAMQCSAAYGGYYNYAAASAGTITGSSNRTDDTYNICPSGWTMPTHAQTRTIGTGDNTYISAFSPVFSGRYHNGSLSDTSAGGTWWSRSAYNITDRYILDYYSDVLRSGSKLNRYIGYSVRCVRT